MKRTEILIKVVTLAVIASLCASFTACNNNSQIDDRTTTTTRTTESEMLETGMSEPNQTIDPVNTDPTTSETSETAAPAGKYTYTLYAGTANEVTISMDVNIDDYIYVGQNGSSLELGRLASDLGWLEQGQYTWDDVLAAHQANPDETNIGYANWYTFNYGDHRAMFVLDWYDEDMPGVNRSQVYSISFTYIESGSSAPFFSDATSNEAHQGLILGFGKHYNDVCYGISGQHCQCSRDDAIIIAYGLWCFANNPDNSMPVRTPFDVFRTNDGGYQLP